MQVQKIEASRTHDDCQNHGDEGSHYDGEGFEESQY